jgi:hypothetical protein
MRRPVALLAATALTCGSFLFALMPAAAAGEGGGPQGGVDVQDDVTGTITDFDSTQESASGEGSTEAVSAGPLPACRWYAYPGDPMPPPEGESGGRWYARYCDNPHFDSFEDFRATVNTWDYMNMGRQYSFQQAGFDLEYSIAPPDQPTPEERMEQIVETLEIPQGELKVNPRPGMQLLNVATWAWLEGGEADAAEEFEEESRTLELDGYTLTFTVTPQLTIDTGDGTTLECEAPGVPWSQAADEAEACTHTYARSGVYEMTATVAWAVTWEVNGEAQDPVEGPTTTDTLEVDVHESQAVVTDVR